MKPTKQISYNIYFTAPEVVSALYVLNYAKQFL